MGFPGDEEALSRWSWSPASKLNPLAMETTMAN